MRIKSVFMPKTKTSYTTAEISGGVLLVSILALRKMVPVIPERGLW